VEDFVIQQMVVNFEKGEDNTEDALRMMQPCQVGPPPGPCIIKHLEIVIYESVVMGKNICNW
jgi:hypothetical protein